MSDWKKDVLDIALRRRRELLADAREYTIEGDKHYADANNHSAERGKRCALSDAYCAIGDRCYAEGDKLRAEADIVFLRAVPDTFGDVPVKLTAGCYEVEGMEMSGDE